MAGSRVEALIREGEATSRRRKIGTAWTAIRSSLGLPAPSAIKEAAPLLDVPPLRWHRVEMAALDLDQLRGLLVTSVNAGFELAAEGGGRGR